MMSTNFLLEDVPWKTKLDELEGVHELGMGYDVLDNILFVLGYS